MPKEYHDRSVRINLTFRVIHPVMQSTRITDHFVFFFHKESPFSNFYPIFLEVDGITYSCNEQYYQSKKALFANDTVTYDRIMGTNDPAIQKQVSHDIELDQDEWRRYSKDIMYRGVLAKFSQNEALARVLLETGDRHMAEASKTDLYWGIGMSMYDHDVTDSSKWLGENMMGELLMRIRTDMRHEK